MINRSLIVRQLRPGLAGVLGASYNQFANQYKDLYEIRTSDKAQEEMVMNYGLGLAPVKSEGAAIMLDDMGEHYANRADHVTISIGFAITEEAIEDNLYKSQAMSKTEALARSMGQTKEVRAAALLNGGFSGTTYGDGVVLFSASHPVIDGGSAQSNTAAVDMSEAALKSAFVDIQGWKDDRGLKVNVLPRKLLHTVNEKFTAFEILKSDLSTALGGASVTNTNNVNSLKSAGIFPEGTAINNFFTDPDAWFIKTDAPQGLVMWNRRAMKMRMDYQDPFTGNIICTASERYSFMVGDWRGVYGSAGAT